MIEDMPRPRLPHLQRQVTQHGRVAWYVRIKKGRRTRLRSAYGSADFIDEYHAALAGTPLQRRGNDPGTLAWLVDRYRETAAWMALSAATRRQRDNIFAGVLRQAGEVRAASIDRSHIVAGRDRRAATPAQARNFLDAMRGLFRWAAEAGHIKTDPTAGVANPRRLKGEGFPSWTEVDVTTYEARWAIGTKQRVWLDVLLYTGLRRGDAVRVGPQHVTSGVITIWTEKTGQAVTIPILPALAVTLAARSANSLSFAASGACPSRRKASGRHSKRHA